MPRGKRDTVDSIMEFIRNREDARSESAFSAANYLRSQYGERTYETMRMTTAWEKRQMEWN